METVRNLQYSSLGSRASSRYFNSFLNWSGLTNLVTWYLIWTYKPKDIMPIRLWHVLSKKSVARRTAEIDKLSRGTDYLKFRVYLNNVYVVYKALREMSRPNKHYQIASFERVIEIQLKYYKMLLEEVNKRYAFYRFLDLRKLSDLYFVLESLSEETFENRSKIGFIQGESGYSYIGEMKYFGCFLKFLLEIEVLDKDHFNRAKLIQTSSAFYKVSYPKNDQSFEKRRIEDAYEYYNSYLPEQLKEMNKIDCDF